MSQRYWLVGVKLVDLWGEPDETQKPFCDGILAESHEDATQKFFTHRNREHFRLMAVVRDDDVEVVKSLL